MFTDLILSKLLFVVSIYFVVISFINLIAGVFCLFWIKG